MHFVYQPLVLTTGSSISPLKSRNSISAAQFKAGAPDIDVFLYWLSGKTEYQNRHNLKQSIVKLSARVRVECYEFGDRERV